MFSEQVVGVGLPLELLDAGVLVWQCRFVLKGRSASSDSRKSRMYHSLSNSARASLLKSQLLVPGQGCGIGRRIPAGFGIKEFGLARALPRQAPQCRGIERFCSLPCAIGSSAR